MQVTSRDPERSVIEKPENGEGPAERQGRRGRLHGSWVTR